MRVKTKAQIQIEQQFLYNLAQVLEAFPQYTISQHLVHFTRRKGLKQELYYWSDERILQRLEDYYNELKATLSTNVYEEDYE